MKRVGKNCPETNQQSSCSDFYILSFQKKIKMKGRVRCKLNQLPRFALVVSMFIINVQCQRSIGTDITVYSSSQDGNRLTKQADFSTYGGYTSKDPGYRKYAIEGCKRTIDIASALGNELVVLLLARKGTYIREVKVPYSQRKLI